MPACRRRPTGSRRRRFRLLRSGWRRWSLGLTELHITETMHQRKAMMAQLSDGFIALPGGFGTFDELFEILTWAQLSVHNKPVGVLDAGGFYQPLRALVEHAVSEGLVLVMNTAPWWGLSTLS
ncbi:TIGR00730 family Rossman fold protein [Chromobacterium piscinae]|uniref:Cytokinin riboside 5'-monophosphate phosphoribohydrolase n=1 Tax=Chromobacterium piscinae TaxID=686831 RepID=A0ABV0H394_9NEIS